ncbi:MAG: hypothetical protein KF745_01160 [Phycisphaeraceae bacterium]|nr:hypothetical protein [Phycisphaeraceae bacterium]
MAHQTRGDGSPGRALALGTVAIVMCTGTALAQFNPSDPILTITGSTGSLTGSATINIANMMPIANGWVYTPAVPGYNDVLLSDNGNPIGQVSELSIFVIGQSSNQPRLGLSFAITNGPADASFTFSSTLLGFPVIPFAEGVASATMGVTDSNGDGVVNTGKFGGGFRFVAQYNGTSTFASLLAGPLVAGANGSNAISDASALPVIAPPYTPIAGAVSSIHSEFSFALTAGDQASATSTWTVRAIPAPGAFALIGAGAVVGLRRRRR